MNNYICCCECEYQDICYNCDAFFGCNNGKIKLSNAQSLINEREDSEILLGKVIKTC